MDEDRLIDQFWDDYYKNRGQRETNFALQKLLKGFRQNLDKSSKTANSIDTRRSLDTIIQSAKEEDFTEIAQTISFAQRHLE